MNPGQSSSHERWIGWTLRTGVLLSALLFLSGLFMEAFRTEPAQLSGGNLDLKGFYQALMGVEKSSTGQILLYAGLLVLILTPIVRVMTAVIGFFLERDWKFGFVSLAVFMALLVELIIASL